MRQVSRLVVGVFTTLSLLTTMSISASAQSGTRSVPQNGSGTRPSSPAGSGQRAQTDAPLALEGYCPVSLQAMNQWVKGLPSIQTVFDGRTYRFANQQGKQMFEADPGKYVPVLGGDCVASLVKMGKRVPGNIRHAARAGGRLFLFANEDGKKMFQADPPSFVNADLAYRGNCVVCSLNMNQTVPGSPQFQVLYNGLRYRFPAAEQRDEFLASPQEYEVAAIQSTSATNGSEPASGSSRR